MLPNNIIRIFDVRRIRFYTLFIFGLLFCLLGPCAAALKGQASDPLADFGVPPFLTTIPVENGWIGAVSGNLRLEIPLGEFPQRGGAPIKIALIYDSRVFPQSGCCIVGGNWGMMGWGFFNSVVSNYPGLDILSGHVCTKDGVDETDTYKNFVWSDPYGNSHQFHITTKLGNLTLCGDFRSYSVPNGDAFALDLSGYHMYVTNGTNAVVYGPDGAQVSEVSGVSAIKDQNGNYVSYPSCQHLTVGGYRWDVCNVTDTLGRSLVTTSLNGNTLTFNVLNSQGGTSTYTATLQTINWYTHFSDTDPADTDISGTGQVIQSINLPDGGSYQFGYDSGTTLGHYGQLTSITLPTGGTINYTYKNFADSEFVNQSYYKHVTRGVSSRTTPDGTWTFTPAVIVQCTGTMQNGCKQQLTVTKPSYNGRNDNEVYKFSIFLNEGAVPVEADYYNGTVTASNLLLTQLQTWDYTRLLSSTIVLPVPGGTINRTTQFCDDRSTGSGNIMSKWEWNFYTGAVLPDPATTSTTCTLTASAPPDRTTTYIYKNDASYLAKNVVNLVASATITDKNGSTVSQAIDTYDGSTLVTQGVTGVTQHDDNNYGSSNTVRGNLTQSQKLVGGSSFLTRSMTYDITGQLRTQTDWSNLATHKTSYDYSDHFVNDNTLNSEPLAVHSVSPLTNALPTTVTAPLSSESMTYTYYYGTGHRSSLVDANGKTWYWHFGDSLNRPTSKKLPSGGWVYSPYVNGVETSFDSSIGITGSVLTTSCTGIGDCAHGQTLYDGLGRVTGKILVSDPDGQTTTSTAFDSNGRILKVSNPYRASETAYWENLSYDGLNRVVQTAHTDGSVVGTYYGAAIATAGGTSTQLCSGYGLGYPVLYVDESGKKRQTWRDGFGRLIEADEPDPSSGSLTSGSAAGTCYGYDLNNNLTRVVQGVQTRTYSYDLISRPTAETNPESGLTTYVYDQDTTCPSPNSFLGQLISKTDARGIRTCMQYDTLNRITQENYNDNPQTPTVTYSYDSTNCLDQSQCYNLGRRTGMSDGSGQTNWSYDAVGKVLEEKRTIGTATKNIQYTYNRDSSVATIQYPSGHIITYQSGDAQRPLWVKDVAGGINYAQGILSPYYVAYTSHGAIKSIQNGSNLVSTLIYNSRLQPCWVYVTTGTPLPNSTQCGGSENTPGNILDLQYNFSLGASDSGNLLSITSKSDPTRSQTFTYDSMNRIATAAASTYAISPQHCWGETYSIDRYGNLSAISVPSSAYNGCTNAENLLLTVSQSTNQIITSGFCYDAAGNMLGMSSCLSYKFDAEKRISSAAGVQYTYDGDGKRVKKSNGTLYWYGTGIGPLAETDLNGNTLNEYVFLGGRRIARRDASGNIFYYFADQLATSRVIVKAGQTSFCYDADFYPYGGERVYANTCPQNYKFTGKERDSESGLDNFTARSFASNLGRFISPDPLAGHSQDPQTLNRYAYVRNNPLRFTDPTGLDFYISCVEENLTCHEGHQGTYLINEDGTQGAFDPTIIKNDSNGGLVDQHGNQYNATVSGAGVSFSKVGGTGSSMGEFINGSDPTNIQGTGALSNFSFTFTYSNLNGNVTAGGRFTYKGTFQQAESALAKAGFYHYKSDEYDIFHPSWVTYHAADYRSPGEAGTGALSGHFTVEEPWMTRMYMAFIAPTVGDVHLGEHNNSEPGGWWPHADEVVKTVLGKLGPYWEGQQN